MDHYVKHQFYEHPAIAAILACHLADNYVKQDESQGHKIAFLDKTIKKLTERVDKLSAKDHKDRTDLKEKPTKN
jgi:hypothetical protein